MLVDHLLPIVNQVFEIEQKMLTRSDSSADRNFKRIYHELEAAGYKIINPLNRNYQETDTDIEATLTGNLKANLTITRVLKPIIYQQKPDGQHELLQKGIVIVEGI